MPIPSWCRHNSVGVQIVCIIFCEFGKTCLRRVFKVLAETRLSRPLPSGSAWRYPVEWRSPTTGQHVDCRTVPCKLGWVISAIVLSRIILQTSVVKRPGNTSCLRFLPPEQWFEIRVFLLWGGLLPRLTSPSCPGMESEWTAFHGLWASPARVLESEYFLQGGLPPMADEPHLPGAIWMLYL